MCFQQRNYQNVRTVPIRVQHPGSDIQSPPVDTANVRNVVIGRAAQPNGPNRHATAQPEQSPVQNQTEMQNNTSVSNSRKHVSSTFSSPTSEREKNNPVSQDPIPMGPPPSLSSTSQAKPDVKTETNDDHRVVAARKQISNVLQGIEDLEAEVNSFAGTREDKAYIRVEHELTNKLLRLDAVNAAGAPGEDDIRSQRKAAVKRVQQTLDILELKVMS